MSSRGKDKESNLKFKAIKAERFPEQVKYIYLHIQESRALSRVSK